MSSPWASKMSFITLVITHLSLPLFPIQKCRPGLSKTERRIGFGRGQGLEVRVAGGGDAAERVDFVADSVGDDERQVRGHHVLHGDHRDGKAMDGWRGRNSINLGKSH